MTRWIFLLGLVCSCGCGARNGGGEMVGNESLLLVDKGQPRAFVITADEPSAIAQLAVEELVEHFKLSCGVEIEVVSESTAAAGDRTRIFIGQTKAAERLGLETASLEPDAFILRSEGIDIYVLGREDNEGYRKNGGFNGTLYGTYELIERALGVRWLWPGELGRHVPQQRTISLEAADEVVTMAHYQRRFRTDHLRRQLQNYQPHVERLAFSRQGLENYHRELTIFMRRHRLGASRPRPWLPHQALARNHLERRPEWFAMNQAGDRVGPNLCISNPDLHQFHTEPQSGCCEGVFKNPQGGDFYVVNLEESDSRTYCHCPECLAWDEPQPEDWPHHITSNRYARYAALVRDLAYEKNPGKDIIVGFLAYMDRLHAPTIDIDLTGVYVVFCPWFSGFNPYYPMPDHEHEALKRHWLGWRSAGVRMHYRPNYLLSYVMPHLSTWQAGDMFRFTSLHGSEGCDFDSLHGHWAVKGPMLYMHLRLAVDPTLAIADLRQEYFAGFGPAAQKVEAYFDYWEEYSCGAASRGGVSWQEASRAHLVYPPECFIPAEDMLAAAMVSAQGAARPEYAQRVAFLQAGLEHARLAADLTSKLDFPGRAPTGSRDRFDAARQALQRLIRFRRDHEHLFIADYVAPALHAERQFEVDALLAGEFVAAEGPTMGEALQPWRTWYFRKDSGNVGVEQRWFAADTVRSGKGLRVYDVAGQTFEIDREIWTPVRVPARLGETDIGDYLGYGWYVTTFSAPEEWAEQPVILHFGAVDEQAWVYVNGQYVGEHTVESEGLGVGELWNRPFSVEAPAGLIRAGEDNLLVVRMHASAGAAGIYGPVGGITQE